MLSVRTDYVLSPTNAIFSCSEEGRNAFDHWGRTENQEQRGARCGLVTVVVYRRCRFDLGRYCVERSRRVIMLVSMDGPSTVAVCVDMACDDSRFTA
jgi:hypothetical protein